MEKDKKGKQSSKTEKDYIIYVPESRNKWLVRLEHLIAFLLTLVVWFFLLHYIYQQLFAPEFAARTKDMMLFLFWATLIVFLVEGGWQFYNWFLFHGKERRREFPPQPLKEVGELYGISENNMEELQSIQKAAVIRYEDNKYYYCIEGKEPIEILTLREKEKVSKDKKSS